MKQLLLLLSVFLLYSSCTRFEEGPNMSYKNFLKEIQGKYEVVYTEEDGKEIDLIPYGFQYFEVGEKQTIVRPDQEYDIPLYNCKEYGSVIDTTYDYSSAISVRKNNFKIYFVIGNPDVKISTIDTIIIVNSDMYSIQERLNYNKFTYYFHNEIWEILRKTDSDLWMETETKKIKFKKI